MFSKKQKNKLPATSYQLPASPGFTLLELVISMAMIAVLTTSAIQVARFSDTHKNLTLGADQLRASIRSTQSSSLSIPNQDDLHICGFGVYFGDKTDPANDTQYELFYTHVLEGAFVANPNACGEESQYRDGTTNYVSIEKRKLPEGATLHSGLLQKTIFFKAPYGIVHDNNGDVLTSDYAPTITVLSGAGANSKAINVNPFGKIE